VLSWQLLIILIDSLDRIRECADIMVSDHVTRYDQSEMSKMILPCR
jgi:hypothetical protein